MRPIKVCYTWAIPGYWIEYDNGQKVFSAYGKELTEDQKQIAHSFPCNCFKTIDNKSLFTFNANLL